MPARPPGQPDVHPAVAVLALHGAHHGQDGAHLRQRPQGGDGLDHAGVGAGRGARDVILQEDHERLGHGHPGSAARGEAASAGGRGGRRHQRDGQAMRAARLIR